MSIYFNIKWAKEGLSFNEQTKKKEESERTFALFKVKLAS